MPVQLRERDFQEIGFSQEQRHVLAPVGTTLEDLEKPEFWAAVSRFLDEEMPDLKAGPDVVEGVRVEFVDDTVLWRVVRESDQYVIKTGLRERGEARRQRTVYLNGIRKAA